MAKFRSRQKHGRVEIDGPALLHEQEQLSQTKSITKSSANSRLLAWSKAVALDPSSRKWTAGSGAKLWKQTLRLRNILRLNRTERPLGKRKFQHYLNRDKCKDTSGLASENFIDQNGKRLGTGQPSSLPKAVGKTDRCASLNTVTHSSCISVDSHQEECWPSLNSMDNVTKSAPSVKGIRIWIDLTESINGPSASSLKPPVNHDSPLQDSDDSVEFLGSLTEEEKLEEAVQAKQSFQVELPAWAGLANKENDAISDAEGSAEEEPGNWFRYTTDERRSRPVIPIGPGFQAEIPEWKGPIKGRHIYGEDSESSKFLGTQVWPLEGRKETRETNSARAIGKGKRDTCSCVSTGSEECIRRHINEARLSLQSNLGPAFLNWKFNEMGEAVSESWTLKEQRKFESMMRTNPFKKKMSFLKLASSYFPSKSQKDIMSYYYNVFIPRRMSKLSRVKAVDDVGSDQD